MQIQRTRNVAAQATLDGIALDATAAMPLPQQLYRHLKSMILEGHLKAETALPSSRQLASDLGIGRNTVIAAYEQLASEGYIDSHERARSFVAKLALQPQGSKRQPSAFTTGSLSRRGSIMAKEPRQQGFPGIRAFHPGLPDVSLFPFDKWRRVLSNRLRPSGEDLFGYHHIAGYPGLRTSIANYLQTSRNVKCDEQQIAVTTGAQAALDILARLLIDPGDDVWLEEPGYLGAQSAFLAAGANIMPLHVTQDGWDLSRMPSRPPKVIYLTPSCQSPLGVTMRMEQRLTFLELASKWGAWVIEDDFDSEYRFTGQPIPAMQGTDRYGRTIYVGTFAKTLMPALRLGFVVLPPGFQEAFQSAINLTGQYPPLALQAALADFMDRGFFAQHLRRTRRLYAKRRDAFVGLCNTMLGKWLTHDLSDTGLQIVWEFRKPVDDKRIASEGLEAKLNLAPLSQYYRHGRGQSGLVMGFAAINEREMRNGLQRLRTILTRHAP